jgi:uncharacterized membrane protein
MRTPVQKRHSATAAVLFDVLDPIAFGFFVAALIFDAVYLNSADVMWFKSAAWLISIGLFFAVVPRLINLARVWFVRSGASTAKDKGAFFLDLLGVAAAIVNAFVHSRDAYAVVPEGLWLSIATVAALVISRVIISLQQTTNGTKEQV